jgi:hypothetical protein
MTIPAVNTKGHSLAGHFNKDDSINIHELNGLNIPVYATREQTCIA